MDPPVGERLGVEDVEGLEDADEQRNASEPVDVQRRGPGSRFSS